LDPLASLALYKLRSLTQVFKKPALGFSHEACGFGVAAKLADPLQRSQGESWAKVLLRVGQ